MTLIRLTSDLAVNPDHVMDLTWDRRTYMNGPGDSVLVITMTDGREHRVKHQPHYMDGIDAYKVERLLLEAAAAERE